MASASPRLVDVSSVSLEDISVGQVNSVNTASIVECLGRLSEAEKVLADVRSVLSGVCGQMEKQEERAGALQPQDYGCMGNSSAASVPASSSFGLAEDVNTMFNSEGFAQPIAQMIGYSTLEPRVFEPNTGTSESSKKSPQDEVLPTTTRVSSFQAVIDQKLLEADNVQEEQFPELAEQLGLTKEQVRTIYLIFTKANISRSGNLSTDELSALLIDMCDGRLDRTWLKYIMDKFDFNHDGILQFDEFLQAFVSIPFMRESFLTDADQVPNSAQINGEVNGGLSLQARDWVTIIGVDSTSVRKYVKKEISEAGSCLAMPLVFAMFVIFFLTTFLHLGYEELHAVDMSIYFDITENANFAFGGDIPFENGRMGHKMLFDVNSFADFWSWFELGITPIFWAEDWELSETRLNVATRCTKPNDMKRPWLNMTYTNTTICLSDLDQPPRPTDFYANARRGTYLYYNSVVGGVRLRQERSDPHACPNGDSDLRSSVHQGLCVPDVGYFLEPELHKALLTDPKLVDRPGGETTYLKSLESQGAIRQEIHRLENQVWLSPYTAKVEVLLTTYNAHLDVFSATFIWLFINRGGHMYKVLEPMSTYMTMYRNKLCYVLDTLLLLLVGKMVVEECREMHAEVKKFGLRQGLLRYAQPANIIDWLSVFYFLFLMIFWLNHVATIGKLQDSLRVADPTLKGSFVSPEDRDFFYSTVDDWAISDNKLHTVLAVFPFITGMRFFKVFSLQPRLGVVTATLQHSFVDIAHFAVVFGSIFLIYVTSAMILFGQELSEFSNFGRSMNTVFRIMLGDYDWDKMIRVGRQQVAMWFWTFTWLVNLIMLNMLLAIIMDVYAEVKGKISPDAETMWSQVAEIVGRWFSVRAGHSVGLELILDALEFDSKVHGYLPVRLSIAEFMDLVPTMPEAQATDILVNAYNFAELEAEHVCPSLSETTSRVQHILRNTHSMRDSINDLTNRSQMMAESMNRNFKTINQVTARAVTQAASQAATRPQSIPPEVKREDKESAKQVKAKTSKTTIGL